jgi:hypothetical protein
MCLVFERINHTLKEIGIKNGFGFVQVFPYGLKFCGFGPKSSESRLQKKQRRYLLYNILKSIPCVNGI